MDGAKIGSGLQYFLCGCLINRLIDGLLHILDVLIIGVGTYVCTYGVHANKVKRLGALTWL